MPGYLDNTKSTSSPHRDPKPAGHDRSVRLTYRRDGVRGAIVLQPMNHDEEARLVQAIEGLCAELVRRALDKMEG